MKKLSLSDLPSPDQVHYVHDLWTMMLPTGEMTLMVWCCPFVNGIRQFTEDLLVTAAVLSPMGDEGISFGLRIEVKTRGLDFYVAFPVIEHRMNLSFLLQSTFLMLLPDEPHFAGLVDPKVLLDLKDALTLGVQEYDVEGWGELIRIAIVGAQLTGDRRANANPTSPGL